MRITQGTFSFLPDLSDAEIEAQVKYCLSHGWPINVEYTDDPHPRNTYWEMFGQPLFDQRDPAAIMAAIDECRKTYPRHYIKVQAFDRSKTRETVALSFIVNRPPEEPGFTLLRQEDKGRNIRYTVKGYGTDRPEGQRYE